MPVMCKKKGSAFYWKIIFKCIRDQSYIYDKAIFEFQQF